MNYLQQMGNGGGNMGLQMMGVDPAAVAAAESAKARIQAAYIMALQKPRNEANARTRILAMCRKKDFAEDVEFSKPVGGKAIKGLSIRFAELALREWQNILVDTVTVYEDERVRRVKINVIDLETNSTFGREIQIAKTVERKSKKGREVVGERPNSYGEIVYTVLATDDELQTKENALISKVIRNEGLRLLPSDLKEEARRVAEQTRMNRTTGDPDEDKKRLSDAFSSVGIMPSDLEKYLKHPLSRISPKEIDELRKIYRAIKDGEASWDDYMEASEKTEAPAANGNIYDTQGTDSQKDAKNAETPEAPAIDGRLAKSKSYQELMNIKSGDEEGYYQAVKSAGVSADSAENCQKIIDAYSSILDAENADN